jgi:hypothetical protein
MPETSDRAPRAGTLESKVRPPKQSVSRKRASTRQARTDDALEVNYPRISVPTYRTGQTQITDLIEHSTANVVDQIFQTNTRPTPCNKFRNLSSADLNLRSTRT